MAVKRPAGRRAVPDMSPAAARMGATKRDESPAPLCRVKGLIIRMVLSSGRMPRPAHCFPLVGKRKE